MTREQKRLAAIFLCLMGILGTLMAMKDRRTGAPENNPVQTETQAAHMTAEKDQRQERVWIS